MGVIIKQEIWHKVREPHKNKNNKTKEVDKSKVSDQGSGIFFSNWLMDHFFVGPLVMDPWPISSK